MDLSLSPRSDLFRFYLPKTFLPEPIEAKWRKQLNRNPGVIITPIDYLNESLKSVSIPGLQDINITQPQHSYNRIHRTNSNTTRNGNPSLGRINVEPRQENTYISPENPLSKIDRKLKLTFRLNQGLYNYFMLYETIFYRIGKPWLEEDIDTWELEILDEEHRVCSALRFEQCMPDGIDGLDFNFENTDRQTLTFDMTCSFNNLNYVFMDPEEIPVR